MARRRDARRARVPLDRLPARAEPARAGAGAPGRRAAAARRGCDRPWPCLLGRLGSRRARGSRASASRASSRRGRCSSARGCGLCGSLSARLRSGPRPRSPSRCSSRRSTGVPGSAGTACTASLGPVHGDAVPILLALSFLAAALVAACEHVLAWLGRTLARLAASLAGGRGAAARGAAHRSPPRLLGGLLVSSPACSSQVDLRSVPGHRPVTHLKKGDPRMHRHCTGRQADPRRAGRCRCLARRRRQRVRPREDQPARRPSRRRARSSASPSRPRKRARPRRRSSSPRPRASRSTRSCPRRAGTREVESTGSGEDAVVTKVTWTGGSVPTGEDAFFQFLGQTDSSKSYTFGVRQTYSDGKVVDWYGSESSDTPSPTIKSVSSIGGGELDARGRRAGRWARSASCSGSSRSSPGGGRWHEAPRAGCSRPRHGGGGARGARRRLGARSAAAHVALGERRREQPARAGQAHLQRGGRAPLRDRLGHRRGRPQRDERPAPALGDRPRHARRPAQTPAGGLVPRLLARDLRRRASGPRRLHVRGRAEPGARAAVRQSRRSQRPRRSRRC